MLSAQANTLKTIRSYHNEEKTRLVVELVDKPNYSTAINASKSVFVIRLRALSNYISVPSSIPLSKQSCAILQSKKLDNKDVRYIFDISKCQSPKVFTLAPSKNSKVYRLVLDFYQDKNETKSGSVSNSKGSPLVNGIDLSVPLKTYERDLFIKYSKSSSDGFRTMSTSDAALYQKELKKLRADYQSAQALDKKQSQKKVAATTSKSVKTKSTKTVAKQEIEDIVTETSAPPVPVAVSSVTTPFIIAIDAGHGGKDPGAIGKRGVKEKNVTLAISKALVNYINSNKQFRGTLIRSSDVFIDLDKRSEIARRRKADLLISIHADSVESGSSTARGASVLVLSERRANRENDKILRQNKQTKLIGGAGEVMDQSVGNPYLATAILDMSSTNSRSEGNLLAKEILAKLKAFTHVRKSEPISASLAVLKSPDIPSLLIETGYLSNRYEEIQLNQPNYQKQIAYRIYLGIKSYYEKYPAQKIKSRQESYARTSSIQGKKSIRVQKGQSLSAIANKYGTSVKKIKDLNKLKSNTLQIGQVLYLP